MSGLLGKTVPSINTDVVLYTVPTNALYSYVNLLVTNTNAAEAVIKVGIGLGNTIDPSDVIEYNAVLPANGGILERTALLMSTGEKLIVRSTKTGVVFRANGIEKESTEGLPNLPVQQM